MKAPKTFQEFTDDLNACGWRSTNDAQHERVKKLWDDMRNDKRATLAGQALTGLLSAVTDANSRHMAANKVDPLASFTKAAVLYADALLAELERQ